jgi:hypothetical protein
MTNRAHHEGLLVARLLTPLTSPTPARMLLFMILFFVVGVKDDSSPDLPKQINL